MHNKTKNGLHFFVPFFFAGCHKVYIITGRGNHSPGRKPIIRPAVEEYLAKENYTFSLDEWGGMITIKLLQRRTR